MRRPNVPAYVLVGLLTVGAIGVGNLIQLGYAAAGVLMAVVALTVLVIGQQSIAQDHTGATPTGADKAVLTAMTLFLGVGVLSVLLTGVFRILEGAALRGASWLVLGGLLAAAGVTFLRGHWPR
ncbi:hypothetical protein GCM10011374_24070 [Kocuria dechangensis]|uniref:Uncharacterized protein n=1 Tax=Kocuria dechangensis TaxID=1176249 RepID=A0A917LVL6_9MICC|nr:hypothetical protein [Kocuria dechangensis]GGG60411.1 hypothetical protein GCM10011374_24070 [Kocuria dechangensis]